MKFYLILLIVSALIGCATNPYEESQLEEQRSFKTVSIPFSEGTTYQISQGAFGSSTHNQPGLEHAWDFDVPYGTAVLAIEGGTVLQVWEPAGPGGCDAKLSDQAHNIKILHPDGTVSQYVHINAQVKVGERIRAQQIIAVTGNNGFHCTPQLHFNLFKDTDHLPENRNAVTIPVLFEGLPHGIARTGYKGSISANRSQSKKIPFKLHDNRIVIPVRVNGSEPLSFIFDTGGARSNTLTPEAAKKLGIVTSPTKNATGAGNESVMAAEAMISSYSVGDLTLTDQKFTILDLSTVQKAFGFEHLDGIVGFHVLYQNRACIDFENSVLILKQDQSDCFGSNGVKLPFKLTGRNPVVEGEVNGIKAEFVIDTGDRSAFSMTQKFADASGLGEIFNDNPILISGVGVGGTIPAKMATLTQIKLGSIELRNVLSRFPQMKSGYFAKSSLAGSLGNEILRRFNIIFDYQKKEMTLFKNRHFNDPYVFVPPKLKEP